MVARLAVNEKVGGSNPSGGALFYGFLRNLIFNMVSRTILVLLLNGNNVLTNDK